MFEPFWRGDAARTSDGSGLGLALAKRIVESLGGTIAVESKPARAERDSRSCCPKSLTALAVSDWETVAAYGRPRMYRDPQTEPAARARPGDARRRAPAGRRARRRR